MHKHKAELILALDVYSFSDAKNLIDSLEDVVDIFKVGSQLFTATGHKVIRYLLEKDKQIFLDLKFYDIPNTVSNAVHAAVSLDEQGPIETKGKILMLTVHTSGGLEMLKAAVKAARETSAKLKVERPLVIGVTVLTSEAGNHHTVDHILEKARMAHVAGCDGVVASVHEASMIRREIGKNFVIVTPGIRLAGKDPGDQKRIATPSRAVLKGSNYLVVGRPILDAKDPLKAAKEILKEIKDAK